MPAGRFAKFDLRGAKFSFAARIRSLSSWPALFRRKRRVDLLDAVGVNVSEIAATNAALGSGFRADKAMQGRSRRRSLPTLNNAE